MQIKLRFSVVLILSSLVAISLCSSIDSGADGNGSSSLGDADGNFDLFFAPAATPGLFRIRVVNDSWSNSTPPEAERLAAKVAQITALIGGRQSDIFFCGSKHIEHYDLVNKSTRVILNLASEDRCAAMVLDPKEEVLYWANSLGTSINALMLDENSTPIGGQIILEDEYIPTAIAVDASGSPEKLLLWAGMRDTGKIERVRLQNNTMTERTVLATDNIFCPLALTVDASQRKVYWSDAPADAINVMDYDGTNRRSVIGNALTLSNLSPVSLVLNDGFLYWTSRQNNSNVKRLNLSTWKQEEFSMGRHGRIVTFAIITTRQTTSDANEAQ